MKTKIWLLTRGVVMVMATMLVFCVTSPASGAEKTYLFKWNNYQAPDTHYEVAHSKECIKKLEEVSNGRMKFKHFVGGALLSANEQLEGVGVGVVDIGNYYLPYGAGHSMLLDMTGLPAIWVDADHLTRANSSMDMIALWDEILRPLNVKMLGLYNTGAGWLFSRGKPIRVPSDLKGRVIKSFASFAPAVAAQGGTAVQLTSGEIYEGLMKGVLDSLITDANSCLGRRWCEVAPFAQMYPFNFVVGTDIMNLKSWNSLTDKDKDLLQSTVMAEHKAFAMKNDLSTKPGQTAYVGLQKCPTELHTPTSEENALWWKFSEPIRDAFRQKLPDKDKQLFDKYLSIANKYR